jgi:hypothetical protein
MISSQYTSHPSQNDKFNKPWVPSFLSKRNNVVASRQEYVLVKASEAPL